MKTNILATAAALSDRDLLARIDALASKEREATAELVAHLAALELRPAAYTAQGYGSLFGYCTQALRLSEDAACSRIEAARACRRFPVILDLLASGALTLTSVRVLGRHLTAENHQAVLAKAANRTKHEIEALVAELAPQPDVVACVRKLPTPKATPPSSLGPALAMFQTATPLSSSPAPPVSGEPSPAATDILPSPTAYRPTARSIVQASAPQRYRVQFTIGLETHEKLRRVQALLRREIPDGDPGLIFARALDHLEKVEKTKLGATARPRPRRVIRSGTDKTDEMGKTDGADGNGVERTGRLRRAPLLPPATSPPTSSAWSGSATPGSARSYRPPGTGVPSLRSWSSITFGPTRSRGRPPLPTFPFAVGGTTSTRPSSSSGRTALRPSVRDARPYRLRERAGQAESKSSTRVQRA